LHIHFRLDTLGQHLRSRLLPFNDQIKSSSSHTHQPLQQSSGHIAYSYFQTVSSSRCDELTGAGMRSSLSQSRWLLVHTVL